MNEYFSDISLKTKIFMTSFVCVKSSVCYKLDMSFWLSSYIVCFDKSSLGPYNTNPLNVTIVFIIAFCWLVCGLRLHTFINYLYAINLQILFTFMRVYKLL